jgi:hypothetical protein
MTDPARTSTAILTDINGRTFVTYAGMSRILKQHGFTPEQGSAPTLEAHNRVKDYDQLTASDWDAATSFNAEVGIKHQYKLNEVLNWLGY